MKKQLQQLYFQQQTLMNPLGRNYTFFESKKKNKKQAPTGNHSRSISSHSDFGKKSARLNGVSSKAPPISQKQKQIREAINYRYAKSKIRDYRYEPAILIKRSSHKRSLSRSSQEQQFKEMKGIKFINLKEYHEKAEKKKLKQQQSNRNKNRLRMRTDGSMIIKTQISDPSMQKIKPYLCTRTKKGGVGEDWRFISIQFKQRSKSKGKQIKMNSHRTLTTQIKSTQKMKSLDARWTRSSKLKDIGKLTMTKKYRF